MRSLSLVAACALLFSGCLFVGDINERPAVQLIVEQPSTQLGVPLRVRAYPQDDQGVASLTLTVRNGSGDLVKDPCVIQLNQQKLDGGLVLVTLVFWRPDAYTLSATATDTLGATGSSASLQFLVTDSPPAFPVTGPLPHPTRAVDSCQAAYLATGPIPIALTNLAVDPDLSAPVMPSTVECGSLGRTISYHWSITAQTSGHGYLSRPDVDGTCPATPAAEVTAVDGGPTVCLYPDPSLSSVKASPYTILVTADDGRAQVPGGSFMVNAIGQSPACLDGAYPKVGSYVISIDETSEFQALGVDDVTPSSALTYRWSLRRAGEADYTVILDHAVGADGGGRLAFDPSLYALAIGDVVSLRVEVTQPNDPAPACEENDDSCSIASCATTSNTCPRRAVWTLEVR